MNLESESTCHVCHLVILEYHECHFILYKIEYFKKSVTQLVLIKRDI